MNSARQERVLKVRAPFKDVDGRVFAELQTYVAEMELQVANLLDCERSQAAMLEGLLQQVKDLTPPADIMALAEQANRAGCLSKEGRQWLATVMANYNRLD